MKAVRDKLVAWYLQQRRPLPWRETHDPYAIWVSEVMLQQTQVGTVLRYYRRFLEAFPSLEALASAPEDAVLARWSGLGYYRRARLLHRGAQTVLREHDGRIPEDPVLRRKLPGIGRYTAGAIGSIAFGLPEPIVDGNVARVFARLFGIASPLGDRTTEEQLWRHADAFMAAETKRRPPKPGILNQALMELGALVCTKGSPACPQCPLRTHCHARQSGTTENLPAPKRKRPPRSVSLCAVWLTDALGAVWLTRQEGNLFGGLWGPPLGPADGPKSAAEVLSRTGLRARLAGGTLGTVTHVLTHRKLVVAVHRAVVRSRPGTRRRLLPQFRAFSVEEMEAVGVSRLTRKIAAVVGGR